MTNAEIIKRFLERYSSPRTKGTLWYEGNTLYSYNRQTPLAVIRQDGHILLNADRYTRATGRHQNLIGSHAVLGVPVSFNALRAANLEYDVPIVAICRPEVVFQYAGQHYLSGVDETKFFLALLPKRVISVEDAYQSLMPAEVIKAESDGIEIRRQGEWFFVKTNFLIVKDVMMRNAPLPGTSGGPHAHIASLLLVGSSGLYVSGAVRHVHSWKCCGRHVLTHEHKTLHLKGVWCAYRNTAVQSWGGRSSAD